MTFITPKEKRKNIEWKFDVLPRIGEFISIGEVARDKESYCSGYSYYVVDEVFMRNSIVRY